jgi:ATP-binding cassette subfamily B protein
MKVEGVRTLARYRHVMGAFAPDVHKQRRKLAGGVGFAVVYALTRVAEPWPLQVVFDKVLFHKHPSHSPLDAPFTVFGTSPTDILAAAAIVLALVGLVRGWSYFYQDYMLSSAAQAVVYGIRTRLYRHLHVLPLSFHQRQRTGDLLVRLSADIILLRDVLVDFIVNLGSGVIMVLLMTAVMFAVDPVLTLVSLAVMPAIVGLSLFYGGRIRTNARRQRKQEGRVAVVMNEALAGMSVVQLHGAEDREQQRYHEINRRSLKQGVKGARLEARMNRSVELALAGGTVVILWVGTLRALHGAITPGVLIVFISYLRAAFRPLRRASKSVQRSAKALAAAERIVQILDAKPELVDSPDARPAPSFRGEIAFDGVSFAYMPGRPVLHDLSFRVQAGRRVAIVGATGSGKSTSLSLVPRLFDPASGRVLIDGGDVRDYTLESLRAQVSTVQQESILFGLSVTENIRYGAPDADDEEVRAAAGAAGMDDFVEKLPDGYDTILAERGASLSGGQRQRVAIARALVRRSPIVVLDEPTSGLDAVTERGILDALLGLMESRTTLLVTHHMSLVRRCDEVIVLKHGEIVGQGTYEDLIERSPQFRRLCGGRDAIRRELIHDSTSGARPARKEPQRSGERAPEAGEGAESPSGPPRADADGASLLGRRAGARPRSSRSPGRVEQSAHGGGPRVMFYSHNGVGVGHLQRQLDLAAAFKGAHPGAAVLVATGSHAAGLFPIADGVDYLKLPAIEMVDRYENWDPRELPVPRAEVLELRSELLERTVRGFGPDLLVADFMPQGPYGELLPSLETLAAQGGVAIAGFRDVVDDPAFVRDLWARTGVYETLRAHYRAICVYGDPAMVDFASAYGLDGDLAAKLRYCGYLGRRPPSAVDSPLYDRPLVLANGGGGVDGAELAQRFIDAAERLRPRRGGTWLLVTGPMLDTETHERLARTGEAAGLVVRRMLPELRAHVALADCVVSMAGYNTCCDLLTFARPSVLVPRRGPSREQSIRAERLAEWRVASVLPPDQDDAEHLADAIATALDGPLPPPPPLPLTGLDAAVQTFTLALAEAGAPV